MNEVTARIVVMYLSNKYVQGMSVFVAKKKSVQEDVDMIGELVMGKKSMHRSALSLILNIMICLHIYKVLYNKRLQRGGLFNKRSIWMRRE